MASLLGFVDSITASPTVRLNLADGITWALVRDGTDFPPPPLKRVVASTMLRDGAHIPASAYDLRRITLDLTLTTGSADDTATALQALHRELDRPGGNILRWQHETTNPVFFRTYRTSASAVEVRLGDSDGRKKRLLVELLAEPFAYGTLETPVSLVTVNTDPANGSNGCFVDVTGVKGDVEAPSIIRFPAAAIGQDQETVIASRRRGTPSGAPFLFQAESMTLGTNASLPGNDANMSGAGSNYVRITPGTTTMATRISTLDLGTASVDLRGRYRVICRMRKATAGDGWNLQLQWGDTDGWVEITNDAKATPSSTSITGIDLGEINIPAGLDPVYDSTGVELSVSDAYWLALQAERTSGTGTIDFDFLLTVAADDRYAIVHWNDDSSSPTDHWILDASNNGPHARDSSGRAISAGMPAISGGLPYLTPNQTNRIYILRATRSGESWTLTTMANVSVSYHPRYLSVKPVST